MKKIFLAVVAVFALGSCTEDVRRNDPALQGLKDGHDWRAGGFSAHRESGGALVISGANQYEALTLELPSANEGTYVLGNSESRKVTFEISRPGAERTFSTGTNRGDGQIVVTEYNEVLQTVTGTFRFNAVDENSPTPEDPDNDDVLNFQYGIFYRIPVTAVSE